MLYVAMVYGKKNVTLQLKIENRQISIIKKVTNTSYGF